MVLLSPVSAPVKSIRFILCWFGQWPGWMRFFLASCAANPDIDWLIVTDCGPRDDLPANVVLRQTTLADYRELIETRLGIRCDWTDAYKLCDFKPVLGHLHAGDIAGYDYWGFGDIDVIYGQLRRHLTDHILSHDLISTHATICGGHFLLVRNDDRFNRAFERVRGWRRLLAAERHYGFDERHWSNLFVRPNGHPLHRRLKMAWESPFIGCNGWFEEQFSTTLPGLVWVDGTENFPKAWTWDNGRLTTDKSADRDFLYLHFTHWQSGRWTPGTKAAWSGIAKLDQCPPGELSRFRVTRDGFLPA
jgi:hypothetical protein